jgi:hypothetical protein
MVSTKARDDLPHNINRGTVDEYMVEYRYQENTAFRRILEDSTVDVYINNDLAKASRDKEYDNSNSKWRDEYNATVVMPITFEASPQRIDSNSVLGFITVDSKTAKFDAEISKAVLGQYCLRQCDLLLMLGLVPQTT